MALFCARYLTSSPFKSGLVLQTVRSQVVTGYYGFQDYAVTSWWRHGQRLLESRSEIDKIGAELYDTTVSAIEQVVTEYTAAVTVISDYSESDLMRHFRILSDDARKWPGNVSLESRTRIISTVIEDVLLGTVGTEALSGGATHLYGPLRYKCHKPWCQEFSIGFRHQGRRKSHTLEHDRPLRCSIDGCFMNELGFSTEAELKRHAERVHSTETATRPKFFASRQAHNSKPPDIRKAAAKGDLSAVKSYMSAVVDVRAPPEKEIRGKALQLAAKNSHFDVCQNLLEQGADPNYRGNDSDSYTPLHAAAIVDDADITHLLLLQPTTDPSIRNRLSRTAVEEAILHDSFKSLSVFIAKGFVASVPEYSGSYLDAAIQLGKRQAAKVLILEGNLDFGQEYKQNPSIFSNASRQGWADVVELLLATGCFDTNIRAALRQARLEGHSETISVLHQALTTSINYEAVLGIGGMLDLHCAIFWADAVTFDRLIRLESTDVNAVFHGIPAEMKNLEAEISPGTPLATPFGIAVWAVRERTVFNVEPPEYLEDSYRLFSRLLDDCRLDLQHLCLQSRVTILQWLATHLTSSTPTFDRMHARGFRMPWAAIEVAWEQPGFCTRLKRLVTKDPNEESISVRIDNLLPTILGVKLVKATLGRPDGYQLLSLICENSELAEAILCFGARSGWNFDFQGEPEILMAAYGSGRPQLLLNLLLAGFDGNKALRDASFAGMAELAKAIMFTGLIDPRATDEYDKSAIDLAREQGHDSIVGFLEAFGPTSVPGS